MTLTAFDVAARLGLDASYASWLAKLEGLAPSAAHLALPSAEEAVTLLSRLGCPPRTAAESAASLPDPGVDPARWWLLERCHARLIATMGNPGAARGCWPQLPAALGPAGSCFPIHLFLATMPATLRWHQAHGIPEEVTWATLADLGRHAEIQEAVTGRSGVDEPWWVTLHLRSIIFELGSLQYVTFNLGEGPEQPEPWITDAQAHALGEGFRPGDPALSVHIPAGAALSPEHREASMALASSFFATHFPVSKRRIAICSSWLLDDQLATFLSEESNIVSFQRSFEIVDGWTQADQAVLWFLFRRRGPDLDRLPEETSLQRAVAAHLRRGGHMRWRTGWRDLPGRP